MSEEEKYFAFIEHDGRIELFLDGQGSDFVVGPQKSRGT